MAKNYIKVSIKTEIELKGCTLVIEASHQEQSFDQTPDLTPNQEH